jgi:arrestin-related trafficking adapter 3/6
MATVQYRSPTSYSILTYTPASVADDFDRPRTLFRPRRVGPGRIRICAVADSENKSVSAVSEVLERSIERITSKLAVSRENARRLLKSVISTDSPSNRSSSKRRSWSPPKRTQSGGSTSEGTGAGADNMRTGVRGPISGPMSVHPARPRLHSDARNTSMMSSQYSIQSGTTGTLSTATTRSTLADSIIPAFNMDEQKPIASGNGVSIAVHLAEPVLFLQGFDNSENAPGNTAMLRGSLHVRVQKSAKIKAITLKFKGKSITKWPEGIPPRKIDFDEIDTIMSHTWPFFNAQFESAEKGTNADHVQLFKGPDGASTTVTRLEPLGRSSPDASQTNLSTKDARKLALSVNQSRSFGKGETPTGGPGVAAKGYRTFLPGDYIYNFELPLDSRLPETIDVELGSVKYELEATVERSGAFKANLMGTKEITLIRAPAEGSLEQVEPIAISRNWEDQLHYDIVISGKSFPLGTQVPIAFKLTPLAKVQCHRIKVLVTENIEYFCSNKRVHRMEPVRKVQLFEKRADSAPTSTFPGSTMRITAGGGIPYDMRARAAAGEDVTPSDTTNLLGNLEGDTIGPTEMEFNVQLPSCHTMKDKDRSQRLHFDTTYQNIQVHHWIKVSK